jgi:hypothetical protein
MGRSPAEDTLVPICRLAETRLSMRACATMSVRLDIFEYCSRNTRTTSHDRYTGREEGVQSQDSESISPTLTDDSEFHPSFRLWTCAK